MSAGGRISPAADQRIQAVFAEVAARAERLELSRRQERAIVEHVLDDSAAVFLRAIHSADFIHRLIQITPSLTERQHRELEAMADELIRAARQVPQDASDRARLERSLAAQTGRAPDALDGILAEARSEWEALKQEMASLTRWLRR
jgi:hypothetical protein